MAFPRPPIIVRWAAVVALALPACQCPRTTPPLPRETQLLPQAAEKRRLVVGALPTEPVGWRVQGGDIVARGAVPAATFPKTSAPTPTPVTPTIFLGSDLDSGGVPLTVEFTATVDNEVPGLFFSWNFGDGMRADGTDSVIRHTYSAVGEYTAQVTVHWPAGGDSEGDWPAGSDNDTADIEVDNKAFDVDVDADPDSGPAPLQVELTADPDTDDADTNLSDYQFDWQLGDGTQEFGPDVTTTYNWPGTYKVTVVVTNELGQHGRASTEVEVDAPDGQ